MWRRTCHSAPPAAIVIGIFVGWRWPDLGEAMQSRAASSTADPALDMPPASNGHCS
jgi:hypothetical protein